MTPRQLRRAAERNLQKQARKTAPDLISSSGDAASSQLPETHAAQPAMEPATPTITTAQLTANRANSQFSTGPKTPEGKAKSSLNAVKTGLTGRTVLLSSDDAASYEKHIQDFLKELRPVGLREHALVQALADNAWRLDRIPALEMAIYAQGRLQFADQFGHEDPALRHGLIELHTFLAYEKQLRNLQLQEMRLRRHRAGDTAELRRLQQERSQREKQDLDVAAKLYTAAKHDSKPFEPAEYGFDFSVEDVQGYLDGVRAANLLNATLKQERDRAKVRANAA